MVFNGFDKFAKSPAFENIIKDKASSLNIAFVCFYGSRNYNLQSDKSDYDFFIVYYPTFDNFYNNRFERYSVIEKYYDYFITPVHEYIRHAMKGNIKFIEPIICGTVFEIKDFKAAKFKNSELFKKIKKFISINYKKNFNAMIGIVNNKRLNIVKGAYTSNTLKYKETHGYDIKEAINSLRILFLLENYIKAGQLSFMVKGNPVYKGFENYLNGINKGNISKEDYLEIFDAKMKAVANLQTGFGANGAERSSCCAHPKSVIAETEEEIKNCVKKLCRDNACSLILQ